MNTFKIWLCVVLLSCRGSHLQDDFLILGLAVGCIFEMILHPMALWESISKSPSSGWSCFAVNFTIRLPAAGGLCIVEGYALPSLRNDTQDNQIVCKFHNLKRSKTADKNMNYRRRCYPLGLNACIFHFHRQSNPSLGPDNHMWGVFSIPLLHGHVVSSIGRSAHSGISPIWGFPPTSKT